MGQHVKLSWQIHPRDTCGMLLRCYASQRGNNNAHRVLFEYRISFFTQLTHMMPVLPLGLQLEQSKGRHANPEKTIDLFQQAHDVATAKLVSSLLVRHFPSGSDSDCYPWWIQMSMI